MNLCTADNTLDEQELFLHYDRANKEWQLETNIPHAIKKYERILVKPKYETDNGRITSVRGTIDTDNYTVSIRKRYRPTEDQRLRLKERLLNKNRDD